ncbi:unnamed protein product [Camellia sinensis]
MVLPPSAAATVTLLSTIGNCEGRGDDERRRKMMMKAREGRRKTMKARENRGTDERRRSAGREGRQLKEVTADNVVVVRVGLEKRIAIVTGGNKGIGLEIRRQLASNGIMVILTARDEKRGFEIVENLKLVGYLLDILVNNAGISGSIIDEDAQKRLKLVDIVSSNLKVEIIEQSYEMGEACLGTNYYGVKLVTEELIPLLQLSDSAKIVNVSSTLGQLELVLNEKAEELSDTDSLTEEKVEEVLKRYLEDLKEDLLETKGWPVNFSAYIMSKAALNAYTRVLAKKYPHIAINAVSPGFVKTDLNHHRGILTVEQGAKGPVMLALLPIGGPSGLFYNQMEVSTFSTREITYLYHLLYVSIQ